MRHAQAVQAAAQHVQCIVMFAAPTGTGSSWTAQLCVWTLCTHCQQTPDCQPGVCERQCQCRWNCIHTVYALYFSKLQHFKHLNTWHYLPGRRAGAWSALCLRLPEDGAFCRNLQQCTICNAGGDSDWMQNCLLCVVKGLWSEVVTNCNTLTNNTIQYKSWNTIRGRYQLLHVSAPKCHFRESVNTKYLKCWTGDLSFSWATWRWHSGAETCTSC
jgi:hypothetical protein